MYWSRLWRKINRPLIAFAVIGFIVVTASQVDVKFEDSDEHRNSRLSSLSDNDLLLESVTRRSDETEQDQIFDRLHAIPVSPVKQLPYCNHDKPHFKTGDESSHDRDGSNSSEEVAPTTPISSRHILVATLDGQLSLLDHGGRILWSIATGQVFSSTISSLQLRENDKWIHLIPSLTGGLYKYDGDSLHPMPLNAETLLRRSFRLSNDVVMTGGKEIRTYGIDLNTGTVRYECGMEGCATTAKAESPPKDDDVVLVVKKQLQTVRAIESSSGSERWNFSVATHELALSGVTEGCYEGEQRESEHDNLLKVVIPEGLVMGANTATHTVWQHKFSSPISQAWVLENGKLKVVDTIRNSAHQEDSPALYIGIHQQQFYVQESHTTADKLEAAFALQSKKYSNLKPLKIGWKPSAAIEGMQDNNALAPYQSDFPGCFILEKEEVPGAKPIRNPSTDDDSDSEVEDVDPQDNPYDYTEVVPIIFVSLWYWWKEVLGISLLTAVVLNLVLMRPVIRAVRTQTVREMWDFFRNFRGKQQEELAILPRRESDSLELPQTIRTRTRTTSSSSSASQLAVENDIGYNFSSQYLREFDPIQCLGRGGFGVVFEAKKKIDDRHYAVKRILLPDRDKSRDKVMREVKALAKLDHRNIVRYFNAWIESPPPGWLEKNDPLWDVTKIDPSSANFVSSVDWGSATNIGLSRRGGKKDYSEISMPSKTPVEEQREPEDSFIVFAESGNGDSCLSRGVVSLYKASGDWDSTGINTVDDYSKYSNQSNGITNATNSVSSGHQLFVRPTSLNIPSSADESWQRVEDVEDDEGIETGIDVANNPAYNPTMYLYIQQELCQKRTLQDWLRNTQDRNLRQVVIFFAQTVEAVEYIHLNKLIHRDLKPGNIFLASSVDSSSLEKVTVKIGDFGLATTAANWLDSDPRTPAGQNPPSNLTGHVGTHLYMSPEQSRNRPYDFRVDIYSLGLIFYELLVPFSTEMERHMSLTQVRKMNFPPSFLAAHEKEHQLISKMVSHNPEDRPNATEIKNWAKNHLLNLSPSLICSHPESGETLHLKSLSLDSSILPLRKGRSLNENERLLNKTQSCS